MDHGCYTLLLSFHQSVGGFTLHRSRVDPRNGCLDMVWLASLGGRRDKLRVLNGTYQDGMPQDEISLKYQTQFQTH